MADAVAGQAAADRVSPEVAHARAYLVAGAGGMLGTALCDALARRGEKCLAPPRTDFDITDAATVDDVLRRFADGLGPHTRGVVLNAAAYTDVEAAEDDAEEAYRVNATGAAILAAAARGAGLDFVHVSTDFVFDGTRDGPYREDDPPNPLSVYGASKLAGERAVVAAYPEALIVRTAWLFGEGGTNFPRKVLAAARQRGELSVVDDEVGSPTYAADLAEAMLDLVASCAPPGVYHLAGTGAATRYELAVETLRLAGVEVAVTRSRSADYPSRVARPLNSVLDCSKAQCRGACVDDWRDGLRRFLAVGE